MLRNLNYSFEFCQVQMQKVGSDFWRLRLLKSFYVLRYKCTCGTLKVQIKALSLTVWLLCCHPVVPFSLRGVYAGPVSEQIYRHLLASNWLWRGPLSIMNYIYMRDTRGCRGAWWLAGGAMPSNTRPWRQHWVYVCSSLTPVCLSLYSGFAVESQKAARL